MTGVSVLVGMFPHSRMYSRHDTGFSQSLIDDVSCISDTETKTVTTASILYVGKAANVSVDSHHMSTMQPWTAAHQTAAGEPLQSISYAAAACGTDLHVIDVLDSAAHTPELMMVTLF